MQSVYRSWGEKVRARRLALGLTQVELAAAIDARQATVSRVERGDQCPSDRLKFRIAGALHETPEHLFPYPAVVPPEHLEEHVA